MDTLSILKLLSQVLIFLTGIWALFSDPMRQADTKGKQKLTLRGWAQVSTLVSGFVVFFISDMKQKAASQEELKVKTETIANQQAQLVYLKQLILYQQRLSDLSLEWTLSAEELARFEDVIIKKSELDDRAYIAAALRHGQVLLFPTGDGWVLAILLDRPQGTLQKTYAGSSPEFSAFKEAMAKLLGAKFELRTSSGRTVFDMAAGNWPTNLFCEKGRMRLTIEEPSLSLGELLNKQVKFIYAENPQPRQLLLQCLHSGYGFKKQVELKWSPVVVSKWTDPDEQEHTLLYYESQLFKFPLDEKNFEN